MKRIATVALFLAVIFFLCSCFPSLWYEYQHNVVGFLDAGYSEGLNKAFWCHYNWDGTEEGMDIILPEGYEGVTVTGLGGYTGSGYPSSFSITPAEAAMDELCPSATVWSYANHLATIDNYNIHYLPFSLHISKSIEEIENLSMGGILLAEYEESGEIRYNAYVLTCYVTCDTANKTFYAKGGKLYFRKGGALVDGIVYEDFDIDKHNEENKDTPCIQSVIYVRDNTPTT